MRRVQGWEARFFEVDIALRSREFDWATDNCGHAMSDVAEALRGGTCPLRQYYEGRKTPVTIFRNLARNGFDRISEMIAAHYDEILPSFAQRGDICVIEINGEEHGGYVAGDQAVGRLECGTTQVPLSHISRAFAV